MERIYLSRRNLTVLLSKLDRVKSGEQSQKTIIKMDTLHPLYPCSVQCVVTAIEDEDYYTDREPGEMHESDLSGGRVR